MWCTVYKSCEAVTANDSRSAALLKLQRVVTLHLVLPRARQGAMGRNMKEGPQSPNSAS